jgi:hypothetical protein
MKARTLAAALALLTLAACVPPSGQQGDNAKKADDAAPAEQPKEEAPAMPVTSAELATAYEENEIAADQKYKGKRLEVTGTITGIDSDFSDKPVVRLNTSNQFMSAGASGLPLEVAATLKKGQKITLICTGKGEVMSMPQLDDCSVEP